MGVEESSVVDCSVGTIVWVRRRNGSWWPGRILGSDELSASHLMSPRSGTPVKLLGRDDASVDWYNLEKSKRVKAFRCGEFDACIERAEASLGIPIKKREKYARREDAILHALELEKQQLEMRRRSLVTSYNGSSNRNSGSLRRDLHSFSSDIYMVDDVPRVHSKFAKHKSQILPRKSALSGEQESKGDTSYVYKGKTSKQSGWEEHNSESVARMRGLQDFGLRIAPSKKKISQSVTWEVSRKPADVHVDVLSNLECMLGDASCASTSKSALAIKRKRAQGGNSEDSLVKKRDRRRPLVQVLQSSAKLPASHPFQSENDSGGISMQEEDHTGVTSWAKRSSSVNLPADSIDSVDNNGYPCEEMPFTATEVGTVPLAEEFSSSELAEETESDSSETDSLEPDMEEDGNLTDTTQLLVPLSKNEKSPVIQLSENFRDPINDGMPLPSYMMGASADARVSNWHMKGKRNIRNLTKRSLDLMGQNGSLEESSFKTRRIGFSRNNYNNNGRYSFGLEGAKDSDGHSPSSHMLRRPHWDESDESPDPDDEMGPMLIDVDVQVQKRSYQGEHVPWVSLSSKWNGGKPILGHPIQIEILEDGSTRSLVSEYDLGLDEIYDAPPAFTRTAKRSVTPRIPRSMDAADPFDSDEEIKPAHKRAKDSYSNKGKHVKRVSMSTKKTRTLSSFATDKKLSKRNNGIFDGLIKPDGGIPLVTCVPVKVAFSRILEAVGRSRGLP